LQFLYRQQDGNHDLAANIPSEPGASGDERTRTWYLLKIIAGLD